MGIVNVSLWWKKKWNYYKLMKSLNFSGLLLMFLPFQFGVTRGLVRMTLVVFSNYFCYWWVNNLITHKFSYFTKTFTVINFVEKSDQIFIIMSLTNPSTIAFHYNKTSEIVRRTFTWEMARSEKVFKGNAERQRTILVSKNRQEFAYIPEFSTFLCLHDAKHKRKLKNHLRLQTFSFFAFLEFQEEEKLHSKIWRMNEQLKK